jgi:hypothetical protein
MDMQNLEFTFLATEDQSPTVRIGTSENPSEAMHSLKGAFSETVYIYGTAIDTCLQRASTSGSQNGNQGIQESTAPETVRPVNQAAPHILSLGLGLGYVELLAAGLILKQAHKLTEQGTAGINENFAANLAAEALLQGARGESFELLEPLRDWFTSWLLGTGTDSGTGTGTSKNTDHSAHADRASHMDDRADYLDCAKATPPVEFIHAYDEILKRTSQYTEIDPDKIRSYLATMLRDGRWKIRGALDSNTQFEPRSFNCICFDAFSSKTSPELWSEDFLQQFFEKTCAETCVLSTYACTGALKRSLRSAGFEVTIREGYSSKRDSTFAVRNRMVGMV